ncbi:MAG: glycosyltransferase family 4 protein [Deltaproteobacteria bacterium]|nr:glycosyltransferase family 4 protein [Deltaproteobacteria bacterium]
MNSHIKLLVNAVPMVNVNTGISRYLRCLYGEMERSYGDRLEIGYFDGFKVISRMPGGPGDLGRWTRGVDLFWRMPVYPALMVRLGFHFLREGIFRKWSRHFDVYHEAGFFPFSVPARLKTVFTIHDLSLIRFPQYHPRERVLYSRLFLRRRCDGVDHFLAVSQFTAREMRTYLGIDPGRTTITPEAHDNTIFYPRSADEIRAFLQDHALPEKYFLFVGSGDPRKNMDVIPEALKKAGLDVPLVTAGWSGWADGAVSQRVFPLGFVSDEDLARAYSGAIGMVFPSTYEGFGLPVLEAMACGCPVVTTRETSLPEVAGDTALYMKDPRDVKDLARILKDLVENHAMRDGIAAAGLERARGFSWKETARKTFEVFEAVLK